MLVACSPQETRGPEVVLPPPNAIAIPPPPSSSARSPFVGSYSGSLGHIVLEMRDGRLVGTSARTTLSCSGLSQLECTWLTGDDEGWAKLRVDQAGNLRGEWGNRGETDASGIWLLVRIETNGDPAFSGDYTSTYGDVSLIQHGTTVTGTYPNGTLSCTVRGTTKLECDWDETGTNGKTTLTRTPDGNLRGTWGNGSSDSDGGDWEMERK